MGFFGSLKKNLSHGGVKVTVDAPAKISWSDASFDAVVSLSAKEPQKINSLVVKLERRPRNQDGQNTGRIDTMISTKLDDAFELQSGETKELTVKMLVNLAKELPQEIDPNSPEAKLTQLAGKAMNVLSALDNQKYDYRVVAIADVEGVSLDPAGHCTVFFFKPGEFGTAIRIGK